MLFPALLVFIAGTTWAGGGGESARVDGKTTLRALNYFDMSSANSEESIRVIWDAFSAANPDIIIQREDLANEPYHQKLEAYIAAGQIPDVMYAFPAGRSSNLQNNHLLKDLTPFLNRDNLAQYYTKEALNPAAQGAGYVAELARTITITHVFYVNREVLDACGLQPAKTYAELKAQAPALKAKGYETIIMANQEPWVMQSCLFSMVAGRFCGPNWTDRILSGQAKFTDTDFVNALNFIKTLFDDGVMQKTTLGVDYGGTPGLFANNKCAYYIDGDWRVSAFITDKSTGQAIIPPERQKNILVTVFPDIEGAKINKSNSVMLGAGWGMSTAIPAGSAREEAAWRLIKWLSGKEVQTFDLETGGLTIPIRTDIDLSSLKLEPLQQATGNIGTQFTTSTKVIDDAFHSDVYNPINDGLLQIAAGTRTPQQAAQDIQRAFDAWKTTR